MRAFAYYSNKIQRFYNCTDSKYNNKITNYANTIYKKDIYIYI